MTHNLKRSTCTPGVSLLPQFRTQIFVSIVQKRRGKKSLILFIKKYIKEYFRPENPSPIVVYGSEQPDCQLHTEWLARRLDVLQKDLKMVAKFDLHSTEETYIDTDNKPFNHFEHFCLTIIADRAH